MAQITKEQWAAMSQEERDRMLRQAVSPHKMPQAFDTVSPTGRFTHNVPEVQYIGGTRTGRFAENPLADVDYAVIEQRVMAQRAAPLRHTADHVTQPGLAYLCDMVCRLDVDECLRVTVDEIRMLDVRPNPSIGGSAFDRVASNIIGAAYNIVVDERHNEAVFKRVQNTGRRVYSDPDRR